MAAKKSFREKVLSVVKKIPKGKTLTYKEVAKRAGNPRAARAVGNIMKSNWNDSIPCHRVVRSDGKPSGYNRGGWSAKEKRLQKESAQR